jgi:hypothetical protein
MMNAKRPEPKQETQQLVSVYNRCPLHQVALGQVPVFETWMMMHRGRRKDLRDEIDEILSPVYDSPARPWRRNETNFYNSNFLFISSSCLLLLLSSLVFICTSVVAAKRKA